MDEKDRRHSQDSRNTGPAVDKAEHPLSDSDSSASSLGRGRVHRINENPPNPVHHDDSRSRPDIGHLEAEAAIPGHAMDVELGQVRHHLPVAARPFR